MEIQHELLGKKMEECAGNALALAILHHDECSFALGPVVVKEPFNHDN